jgi:hypothetical protein
VRRDPKGQKPADVIGAPPSWSPLLDALEIGVVLFRELPVGRAEVLLF